VSDDLAARVTAVLARSVLPSVIARGGAIRVVGAGTDGVVTLEVTGSPGAGLPLASRIEAAREVLDAEVNPAIAAHRGHVTVTGAEDGWIRIRLDGGCQGCALAEVTIRQGIEPLLRDRLPAVTGLTDVTDHEAGTDPFFSPEKR
jgi:Fe-S cluster biogenesis protein NfuA